MSRHTDDAPVYYREIQKNAFLKRVSPDAGASKLRPLGHKKPPPKALWTLFCVHNGRIPYLEQYPDPEAPGTVAHKPMWRANLSTARHVTASVKAWPGNEFDFLVTTDEGPVRMLAPDWESMQDWVLTLRNKLHELKVLSKTENVYCPAPAPPVSRAGTRDPTSPLPPTPAGPPVRVPGIELVPQRAAMSADTNDQTAPSEEPPVTIPPDDTSTVQNFPEQPAASVDSLNDSVETVDRIPWDTAIQLASLPGTSEEQKIEPRSLANICGQNICLDDSLLKRNSDLPNDSDEEFFAEIDRLNLDNDVNSMDSNGASTEEVNGRDFKQRLVVCSESEIKPGTSRGVAIDNDKDCNGDYSGTNITVIQVSNNRGPPYTAIPILGAETDIFKFDFKQNLSINNQNDQTNDDFVNIVNTESNEESPYGHLSLTTTVNLTGVKNDSVYERLCMASTSKSPIASKRIQKVERDNEMERKTSLPNLEINNTESAYEYLFPGTATNANLVQVGRENVSSIASSNSNSNTRVISPNVDRSNSQRSCENGRLREQLLRSKNQHHSPKRDNKAEQKQQVECNNQKRVWKRGLTELSLLSRLRGIAQTRHDRDTPNRQYIPNRHQDANERMVTSSVKVVHRSRAESRADGTRRRSSSLSNAVVSEGPCPPLVSLRSREAAILRAEQARGAACVAAVSRYDPPVFGDANGSVWIARWGRGGHACGGRAGDRVVALGGHKPRDAAHAISLLRTSHTHMVDILFHRVPHGKIYVLNKKTENQNIGIKLDGECQITSVEMYSPAQLSGIPPAGGRWCLTEVNNRQLNLLKGAEEEMLRLSSCGCEVSVLIQPAPLVKRLRAALKGNKTLLNIR